MLKLQKETVHPQPLHIGYDHNLLVRRSNDLAVLSQSMPSDIRSKLVTLLDDVSIMLMKLPNSLLTKNVQSFFKHMNISFRKDKNSNVDRVPRLTSHLTYMGSKLSYISAGANSIGLDYDTLDSNTIDSKKTINALYHGLIRAAILETDFRNTSDLLLLLTAYYKRLLMHTLDLSGLNDVQTILLEYTLYRILHTTVFKLNVRLADDYAIKYVSKNSASGKEPMIDSIRLTISDNEELFKNATSMRSVFSLLNSLGVIFDSESTQISKVYSNVGVNNFLNLTSSLDFVVASIVLAKYDKLYTGLDLDRVQSSKIEAIIQPLIRKLKFGTALDVTKI